jgi:hypothetical protein
MSCVREIFIKISFLNAYHQEIRVGSFVIRVRNEDLRALEILGKRRPEVRILEQAEILSFGGIGLVDLLRLHGEICHSQTTTRKELLIYIESTGDGLAIIDTGKPSIRHRKRIIATIRVMSRET